MTQKQCFDFSRRIEITQMPAANMAQIEAKRRAIAEWEKENPERAKAWQDLQNERQHEQYLREIKYVEREGLRRALIRLPRLGVPVASVDAIKSGMDETVAFSEALSFMDSNLTFLVLFGTKGTGKTTAAAWAFWHYVSVDFRNDKSSGSDARHVPEGIFMQTPQLGRLSLFGDDAKEFEKICATRCLVLDDYGTEPAAACKPKIEEIIIRRDASKLKTIITTNLDGKELRARLGDRILDRMKANGRAAVCQGESLRRPATIHHASQSDENEQPNHGS